MFSTNGIKTDDSSIKGKKRIDFIDTAKGFCIMLVVFTHVNTYFKLDYELYTALASFRMPLYFVLSGLFFKTYAQETPQKLFGGVFIRKKINNLLIPFFFYIIFSVAIPNVLAMIGYDGLRQGDKLGWKSIFNFIFERHFSNSPIWFLLCLFFLNIYFYYIHKLANRYTEKTKITFIMVVSVLLGGCGYLLGVHHVFVWMFMDCALTAMPFFCFGYILNRYTDILRPCKWDKYLTVAIILSGVFVFLVAQPVSFVDNSFSPNTFFALYSCGMIGTIMVLFLSKMLHHIPLVSYWGKYSIIVLCLHMPVIQVYVNIIRKIGLSDGWSALLVAFALTMLTFLAIIPFMKKYFPFVTAQKPLLSV